MLYIVTLTYLRPIEEVNAHLDTHRQWLVEHTKSGHILWAGPLEDRTGGMMLAHCGSRAELDGILARDPFLIQQVVSAAVQGVDPVLRAESFPSLWSPLAKAVSR